MSAPFDESKGSPVGTWQQGYFLGKRVLTAPYADRGTVRDYLSTYPNDLYPDSVFGDGTAVIRKLECTPFAKQDGETHLMARFKATYTNRGPIYCNGVLLEERLEPFQTKWLIDSTQFSWDSASGERLAKGTIPPKQLAGAEYQITFFNLNLAPMAAVAWTNYVNSNAFYSYTLGYVFAADTLLYIGPKLRRGIRLGQPIGWDVTYHFVYWPWGWNKFCRMTKAGQPFEAAYIPGTDDTRFYLFPQTTF